MMRRGRRGRRPRRARERGGGAASCRVSRDGVATWRQLRRARACSLTRRRAARSKCRRGHVKACTPGGRKRDGAVLPPHAGCTSMAAPSWEVEIGTTTGSHRVTS
ncbi:hypothetical protein PVAP13_1KG193377 [Panicum virgatum]|uniref:Uncharacterized protein n=1 Tax=Panicum virgatum TaxID=38727 RepID=A0A8T0XIG7_PANVG|nr:hypothetical protein PVAP13_1KG193377 [Panicum virgatum]